MDSRFKTVKTFWQILVALWLVVSMLWMTVLPAGAATVQVESQVDASDQLLQFTSGGQVQGDYLPDIPVVIDPDITWNTFLGGTNYDYGYGIAVDSSGNVYVTGSSYSWGNPVRAYTSNYDAFVAKLDSSGALQWNTFLGGTGPDFGYGIAVDSSGNIYVTGYSSATWGTPVRAFSGSDDAFVARLNSSSGALQWNTFLGGGSDDLGYGIAVDSSGGVYVTGYSIATWGTPVRAFSGSDDAFVARLNSSSGALQWNTFLGGTGHDEGYGIAVDFSGNVYVTGYSYTTWGSPVMAYQGGYSDAFAARLNITSGALQWNTFLGGTGGYNGRGITVDSSGNVYVTGDNGYDAFAAKLNNSGVLQWNTFLGGAGNDHCYGIAVDSSGSVYLTGYSDTAWGSPIRAYGSYDDAFAAVLDSRGVLQWNTFLGGTVSDYGRGIAVDTSGSVYVTGYSSATWKISSDPVRAYTSSNDAFVARLRFDPTVAGISPNFGTTAGGGVVTITGTRFYSPATVTIGGVASSLFVVDNATQIRAVAPAGTSGARDVVVTTPSGSGTLSGGITYYAVPTITGISPSAGPLVGGTSVTITGANFVNGSTGVTFGGTTATDINVDSSTRIIAALPSGTAGAQDVVIITPSGSATLSHAFTFCASPTITGISPASGTTAGGTVVTITGTNFYSPATVTIGGFASSLFVVDNATQIKAVTPAGTAGAQDVVVTNPDGQSGTLPGGFIFDKPVVPTPELPTGVFLGTGIVGIGAYVLLKRKKVVSRLG